MRNLYELFKHIKWNMKFDSNIRYSRKIRSYGHKYLCCTIYYTVPHDVRKIEWSLQRGNAGPSPYKKKVISFEDAIEHMSDYEKKIALFNLDLFE